MCQVLTVSKSGYYKWKNKSKTKKFQEDQKILEKIRIIYLKSNRTYGSPRITAELRDSGIIINKKKVVRLMRDNSLISRISKRKKFNKNKNKIHPLVKNIVNRNFEAIAPNHVWLSDITYIKTGEGWLYLAAILDVYSRKIVGLSMNKIQSKELVSAALSMAVKQQAVKNKVILHSDQGSQYSSYEYQKQCKNHGFVQSMSNRGNCYDNAMMESFFHTLKTEKIYSEKYQTREEAKKSIFEYIEIYYNRKRLHSGIGYKTPIEFEKMYYNS